MKNIFLVLISLSTTACDLKGDSFSEKMLAQGKRLETADIFCASVSKPRFNYGKDKSIPLEVWVRGQVEESNDRIQLYKSCMDLHK